VERTIEEDGIRVLACFFSSLVSSRLRLGSFSDFDCGRFSGLGDTTYITYRDNVIFDDWVRTYETFLAAHLELKLFESAIIFFKKKKD
jgi:hypothetical protein